MASRRRPRYKYLTRSYVQAMQLEQIPVKTARNQGYAQRFDNWTLPPAGQSNIHVGVRFEENIYLRSPCGLSYDLSASGLDQARWTMQEVYDHPAIDRQLYDSAPLLDLVSA